MREFYENMEWISEQNSNESGIGTLQLIKIQINAFPIISQSSLTQHWQVPQEGIKLEAALLACPLGEHSRHETQPWAVRNTDSRDMI